MYKFQVAFTIQPNKSMVISTLALRFSLCKLASVAEGDSKKEIMLALGLDTESKVNIYHKEICKDNVVLSDW